MSAVRDFAVKKGELSLSCSRADRARGSFQALYQRIRNAVVPVSGEMADGTHAIGTTFHVVDGFFLTADHVIEQLVSYTIDPEHLNLKVSDIVHFDK